MAIEPAPPPHVAGESYLEWGAVLGGAAVATAISVVLTQFGAAAGLGLGEPTLAAGGASWQVLAAGLWVVLIALASAVAGGYIAGRMRSRFGDASAEEVEFRDGAHGLVVWAVSTLGVGLALALASALAAIGGAVAAPMAASVELSDEVARFTSNISAIFAFAAAAGAALSAAGAWQAAKVGGEHRDKGISVDVVTPRPFRRKQN